MDVTWIKLATGLFGDTKIKYLRQQKNGDSIALFWVGLLTLAGECNDKGMIYVTPKVPYTYQGLADSLGFPLPVVKKAIPLFVSLDMLEESEGFLCIVNWNEHQNVDRLEQAKVSKADRASYMREYMREYMRKKRSSPEETDGGDEGEELLDNVKHDVKQGVKHLLDDVKKEEKSTKKEENKEGEEEIDNSSNSSSGSVRAYARYAPQKTGFEGVFSVLFVKNFVRYPTASEKKEACEMMRKTKDDELSDDELFLLNVAFESALKANVHEVYYLQGCFKNFEKQGIKTRQQYEDAVAELKAKREAKKQAAERANGEASYGDSEDFYQAALRAGMGG